MTRKDVRLYAETAAVMVSFIVGVVMIIVGLILLFLKNGVL